MSTDRFSSKEILSDISTLVTENSLPYKGVMGVAVSSKDFNDYKELGIYRCAGTNASGVAHAPNATDNGFLIVFELSELYILQLWVGTYQGDIAIRYFHTDTWSEWRDDTIKSISTGITGVSALKNGRMVQLNIVPGASYTYTSAGWQTIGTLPASLRPYSTTRVNLYDNAPNTYTKATCIPCIVSSTGAIQVYAYSDKLTFCPHGTVSYFTV